MLTQLKPKTSGFDNLAIAINREHQQCLATPQAALIPAYNAGVLLLQAQAYISPQDWQSWLQLTQVSPQTAETYMQIARTWPGITTDTITATTSIVEYAPKPKPSELLSENVPSSPPPQEIQASDAPIDVEFTPVNPVSEIASTSERIKFVIFGPVVPKARPRVTNNGTYLPPRYREWRNRAEVELYRQICDRNLTEKFPLKRAAVTIRLFGNHRTNSDIDNLAGACLDALTLNGAGILLDDRLSCLPQLKVEYIANTPKTGVWIEIEPLPQKI